MFLYITRKKLIQKKEKKTTDIDVGEWQKTRRRRTAPGGGGLRKLVVTAVETECEGVSVATPKSQP